VNLERFEGERSDSWRALEGALARAGDRPERLGADGVLELGALYRSAAADLAYARRRFPGDPVTARLERLVVRARAAVYARASRRGSLAHFYSRGYWRRIAERPVAVLAAWALLLTPVVAGAAWGVADPPAAAGLVPAAFQAAADPPSSGRDFTAGQSTAFSVSVMTNNFGVTLIAFAGGIAFGLVTAAALAYNGLLLGTLGGLAFGAGNGEAFVRLVSAHGLLELSCIVVGGAAGLRVGWALLRPGVRRRGTVLVAEARNAVEIAAGTAPFLVICGLAEGFLTGPELPVALQVAIGVCLAGGFWALVVWRGRPDHSRARALARR
jgi:uncharacterized membrane protein SpoIIM required for sporulation